MSSGIKRKVTSRPNMADAKETVLDMIRQGHTVSDSMNTVGRSVKAYEQWKNSDELFSKQVAIIRAMRKGVRCEGRGEKSDSFADFRKEYLGMETFLHQQQWIDIIEGRAPDGLHPSQTFEQGDPHYVLINTAPEHSKTMTLSIDYVTYRICKDPSIRVLLVSKTQEMAKQFLYAIKQRLTHPKYAKLQINFAPADGFKGNSSVWQSNMVYLGEDMRDGGEKDPTINAIGLGGQIYGARADLIICDDCVVLSNANQYENQIRWLQQEVVTRLGPGGKLIVAGTRVDPVDLYRELRNPDRYADGRSPWTYLAQPAVLEYAEDPNDWVTLWPKSNVPWAGTDDMPDVDGLYPRWDGTRLSTRRKLIDPKTWAMVYMQAETSDVSVFDAKAIRSCVNGMRYCGLITDSSTHRRPEGMQGLYVICSMDPAMAGDTATIVYAIDVKTQKRFVLDANRMTAPSPKAIRDIIKLWTDKYKPMCWVIEKNAFQLFLTRDSEIREYLANRGVSMLEHYTGSQKQDPDFGVASLAPLFTEEIISLPSSHNSEGIKALIEQLITWQPGKSGKELKMDFPMSLWFAETKAREVVHSAVTKSTNHRASKYMPRYRKESQMCVNLDEFMAGSF